MAVTAHNDSATEAFRRAVDKVGGQSEFARLIGRTQGAISKRLRATKPIWAEAVLLAEAASGVSRHDLRPDIYPIENSGPQSPEAAPAAASELCAAGDRNRSIEGLRS